jgi:hypothetical protein
MGAPRGDRELLRSAHTDPEAIGVLFRRHAAGLERFLAKERLFGMLRAGPNGP